jgi:hypothetical protein
MPLPSLAPQARARQQVHRTGPGARYAGGSAELPNRRRRLGRLQLHGPHDHHQQDNDHL